MSEEEIVVEYIEGAREVPSYMQEFVEKYRSMALAADECLSYPRRLDRDMDKLYDVLVAMVKSPAKPSAFYVKYGRKVTRFQHVAAAVAYWQVARGSVLLAEKDGEFQQVFA